MNERRGSAAHAISGPLNLSPTEKAVLRDYGGWAGFMGSHGLRALNPAEEMEGQRILKALALAEDENARLETQISQDDTKIEVPEGQASQRD